MNNTLALPWLGIQIDRSNRPARYTLTALLLACTMFISGYACTMQQIQNWVNNTETILEEVTPAVQIVISLLPLLGTAVPPNLVLQVSTWTPKVEKDVTDLGSLITQYQGDLTTNVTAQGKINALILTTQQDVLSILPDFNVLDPTSQAKVVDAINIIAAAITSVENIINGIEGNMSMKAIPGGYTPVRNGKEFKTLFNDHLTRNFGKTALHLN
jgi:hypothetical protein